MSFDTEKSTRIAQDVLAILRREDANAGEACAAISYVFKECIETAPNLESRAQIRAACIAAMDLPRPDA